jgi:hypothetical protein
MKGKSNWYLSFVHSLISSKTLSDLDHPRIRGDKVTQTLEVHWRKLALKLWMAREEGQSTATP